MLSDSKIYYHTYIIMLLRLALCGESGMFMCIHGVVFVVNGDCFDEMQGGLMYSNGSVWMCV